MVSLRADAAFVAALRKRIPMPRLILEALFGHTFIPEVSGSGLGDSRLLERPAANLCCPGTAPPIRRAPCESHSLPPSRGRRITETARGRASGHKLCRPL